MEEIIRIGMDTSKSVFQSVFQLHGVNAAEQPVLRRKLRRREVLAYFAKLKPILIAIEACGGSHYWARELGKLGHEVRLLPPQYVKAYVKRGKNDAADAAALCEAVSRPGMSVVLVKSEAQQAAQMMMGVREQLVRDRTQLTNAIRGHAAEFGLIAAKGLVRIAPLLERVAAEVGLPELARRLFAAQGERYAQLEAQIAAVDAELATWQAGNAQAQALSEIPGIGPIGSALLVMKTTDPKVFTSARHFGAYLGLTPKDHSTAGRQRLGVITRAGDETLRSVLVAGATSVIKQVMRGRGPNWPWLVALVARKPPKLAAVALANKLARIAWTMMVTGETYRDHPPREAVAA